MARNAQQISGTTFWIIQSGKYQISVVVISMQKKAVVPIPPRFPWKKTDILRLYGKYLASAVVIKCLYFGIGFIKPLPNIVNLWLIFGYMGFRPNGICRTALFRRSRTGMAWLLILNGRLDLCFKSFLFMIAFF